MDKTKPMGLPSAIKDYFNIKENGELMKEYKALTKQDKADLKAGLEKEGYIIQDNPLSTAPDKKDDESIHAKQGYAVGEEHPAARIAA